METFKECPLWWNSAITAVVCYIAIYRFKKVFHDVLNWFEMSSQDYTKDKHVDITNGKKLVRKQSVLWFGILYPSLF